MSDDAEQAQQALAELWERLDELQRQSLVTAVARAVAADATIADVQEWIDALTYDAA